MNAKRIILLRHGESEANVDPSVYSQVPDWQITLTEYGILPAKSFSDHDGYETYENAYISAFIPDERIDESIRLQTGHEFGELPEDMKKSVQESVYRVGDTLEKIMEGVVEASSNWEDYEIPENVSRSLSVDFCQLAFAF